MARCWLDFHNPDKTVILAGCGRSGTTWLGEAMNYRNAFRMMFEPFYPARVPELKDLWRPQQYLRPGAAGPGPDLARRILEGRIRNEWVDQFNRRSVASRRLIKEVRLNLSLRWIRDAYPRIPIVFMLRHPIPTVLSQLKLKWNLPAKLFLDQPELMADFLEPYRRELEDAGDPFAAQIAVWCVMNLVPLRQFAGGGLHVVFYEDVCQRPREVLPPLFRLIGEGFRPWILDRLGSPSRLSKGHSAVVKGTDPVESWVTETTPAQRESARRVLERFGLDRVYGDAPMPRLPADQVAGLFR